MLEKVFYNKPLALDGINFRLLSGLKALPSNGKLFITPKQ